MLTHSEIDMFTLSIKDGYFYWQVKLKDGVTYQIMFRIEKHITPAGNRSKKKVYFIKKDNKELVFDEVVNKWFKAFRYPYIRCGI